MSKNDLESFFFPDPPNNPVSRTSRPRIKRFRSAEKTDRQTLVAGVKSDFVSETSRNPQIQPHRHIAIEEKLQKIMHPSVSRWCDVRFVQINKKLTVRLSYSLFNTRRTISVGNWHSVLYFLDIKFYKFNYRQQTFLIISYDHCDRNS